MNIPTSTKWDVGLSIVTFLFIVGAIITSFIMYQDVSNFDELSGFTKLVLLGAVVGTFFGVILVAFNITCFILVAIGSIIWAGLCSLKEKLRDAGQR